MPFTFFNTKSLVFLLSGAISCFSDQAVRQNPPVQAPLPTSTTEKTGPPATDAAFAVSLLAEVNALRTAGCRCPGSRRFVTAKALSWDDQLARAAQTHADDMARHHFMDHTGSDGSDFSERIEKAGYRWRAVAENLAEGYPSAEEVVNGWRNSKGHCKNLMDNNLRDMGAARSGEYWVQTLGTRM